MRNSSVTSTGKVFTFVGLLAVAICLAQLEVEAQKTIAGSFQQQVGSTGNGQNSVYGGYQSSSNSQRKVVSNSAPGSWVSPVNQQRQVSQSSYSSSSSSRVSAPRPPPVEQQQQQEYSSSSSSSYEQQAEADAEPASYGAVQGQPGVDFPAYTRVPKTSFSCDGLPYEYGMYADEQTGCQAYHVCHNGRRDSFLCGTGTLFNQRILHCDYWYSVECGKSSQYYSSNAYMGSSQPEPGPAQAGGQSYKRTESSSSSSSNSYARPPVQNNWQQQSSFSKNTQQVQEAY